MSVFKTISKSVNELDGDISFSIDFDLIKEDVDSFNKMFSTTFTVKSSKEDIVDFFKKEYLSIFKNLLLENKSAKTVFNNKFNKFANID